MLAAGSSKAALNALLAALASAVVATTVVAAVITAGVEHELSKGDDCLAGPAQPGSAPPGENYQTQEVSETARSDIPSDYLALYQEAASEYGIDWAVLAAIGKIETDHGRLDAPGVTSGENFAGAGGPMQFLAETWELVGVDGNGDGAKDRYDPEDAIPGAANYLVSSGAPDDYYAAIFAYNRADWYVSDVLAQAEEYRAAEAPEGAVPAVIGAGGSVAGAGAEAVRSVADGAGALLELAGPEAALADENGWDLVDDGRRLDYEDYTAYDDALDHAASKWDAMGSVAVEPSDGSGTDVVVGDGDLPEGVSGQARSSGEIIYANAVFGDPDTTDNARRTIALHEFGHALGFDHEYDGPSVMYNQPVWNGTGNPEDLTELDKENYYARWGEPVEGTPVEGEPGEVQGNTGAVFPLDEEHFDSYTDTWGASRSGGSGVHEGTDLIDGVEDGDPLYSITNGTVVTGAGSDSDGWNELGGWTVMIEASESVGPIQAGDMLYYAHMLEPTSLEPGTEVKAGDQIGKVGSTGEGPPGSILQPQESRGHHLHLGWYDPSGARAEMPSGAMNPYPMLEWLKENGGTVTGGSSVAPAPCEEGTGPGVGGTSSLAEPTELGSGDAKALLEHPNFTSDPTSVADLEGGVVDGRLISVLLALADEHEIYVSCIKSGHPYGAYLEEIGMPDVPNSHYSGRTADISKIDGQPVLGNGSSEAFLDVGRILAGIPPGERPDEIIGPVDWHASLGYGRSSGWIEDGGLQEAHSDHFHVGFQQASGTSNTQ